MNASGLLKVTKAITILIIVIVVLAVFVRVMYGGDPQLRLMPMTSFYNSSGIMGEMMDDMMEESVSVEGMPVAPMRQKAAVDLLTSGSDAEVSTTEQKIIRTGSLSLRVDSADWTVNEITRIANDLQGLVASSNVSDNGEGVKSGTLTVRVPVASFDTAMQQLKQTGRVVLNETVSGQDITEQVIDMEARIKNKQAEEEAYTAILKNQAQKVSDVIEVTRALNQVRSEIESLQTRLKYLNSQADMATITVRITEDPKIGSGEVWRPWQVVKDSVNMLIKKLQSVVDFFIQFIVVIIPTLLLFVFGVWILYLIGRGIYRKIGRQ